ncbi:dTDP-4-dehydrorhamnose reductase [Gynuella sunshinyii]|uniref:dTDP-4-dehydrorhamnose reductase n=1 Tax=Gynuella sunshinyii YC6258 TaxID=1445510 RepID=A0A0C5UYQ1_9GAMM|nr:dTDP-4-dehydrorhamnose reductase [Gynuella sunshinyii]AJQ92450.1 dTDP-4-dehydrorhamnose reductase [Gynuella sunshinyii YC6258]
MKIILLGKDGQVGWELQHSLAPLGELIACGRQDIDLTDSEALAALLYREKPDVLVNAAAYTAVDKAETEVELAHKINADAVAVMSRVMAELKGWFVHYSTDYVFDGTKTDSYEEEDDTGPLNVYGQSKLSGEQAVAESGCHHLLFRVSWVYASRGANFIRTMLRLGQQRDQLSVINDQVGVPTSAEFIAQVTALALYHVRQTNHDRWAQLSGIYHLVPDGEISWLDFARYIFSRARDLGMTLTINDRGLAAISTAEYGSAAQRPLNSRLNTSRICKNFNLVMPDWQVHADKAIREICLQGGK